MIVWKKLLNFWGAGSVICENVHLNFKNLHLSMTYSSLNFEISFFFVKIKSFPIFNNFNIPKLEFSSERKSWRMSCLKGITHFCLLNFGNLFFLKENINYQTTAKNSVFPVATSNVKLFVKTIWSSI